MPIKSQHNLTDPQVTTAQFDAGPSDIATAARHWLARTEDVTRDAVRAHCRGRSRDWRELVKVLSDPSATDLFPPAERWQAWWRRLRPWHVHELFAARVRLRSPHAHSDMWARIRRLAVPEKVSIEPSSHEHELLSEMTAAEAVGRSLAMVLVNPTLAASQRVSQTQSLPRTMGALFAQCYAERVFLLQRGLSTVSQHQVETLGRRAALAVTLDLRCRAAWSSLAPDAPLELQQQVLSQAWAVGINFETLEQLRAGMSHAARFRAGVAALAIAPCLRERYDEDWFANPRAGEPLLGGAERGGLHSAEAWCEELGGSVEGAILRLEELLN